MKGTYVVSPESSYSTHTKLRSALKASLSVLSVMDLPETVPLSGKFPEATGNEYLILATKALRHHLGLAETPGEKSSSSPPSTQPLFWVEVAPPSARGARCQLDCPKNITPGEYRIAVNPGQHGHYGNRRSGTSN
jgi:hypothetical protein